MASKSEVQQMDDLQLMAEWQIIKAAYQNKAFIASLDGQQYNILFATWINVSNEMDKRNLPKF